jgi:hypothetical protein
MWFWFGCMVYLGPEIRNGNQNADVPGGAAARGTKEALWVDALTSKRPVKAMTLGRINVTLSPFKRNLLYVSVTIILFLFRCKFAIF